MSSHDYLFVPVQVKALVVNDEARQGQNFQRWKMNCRNLESYLSPVPEAFEGNTAEDWPNEPGANGVYLHWSLPESLRRGVSDSQSAAATFPLVPNRWLILRYSGAPASRTAAAWIVESDFLDPDKGTTSYIDPFSNSIKITNLGRKLNIDTWKEKSVQPLFLTAEGPADIAFASYQPYVENVFSIHDPLTDVSPQEILSYFVAGWYSDLDTDDSKDILTAWGGGSFSDWLESLNWQVNETGKTADRSVYHGLVYGIDWQKTGPIPESARPEDPGKVTLAVGNTSIDALTALISEQAEEQGMSDQIDARLLEAFQYDLLSKLDEPGGEQLLNQAIHKAWFAVQPGGYLWTIVKRPEDKKPSPYPAEPADTGSPDLQPPWLATLNQDQTRYDSAEKELSVLQWRLYSMWWTRGRFSILDVDKQKILEQHNKKFTAAYFEYELNPSAEGSLAYRVRQQIETAGALLTRIPHGKTQAELLESIKKFAAEKGLPEEYRLKRVNRGPYYEANNPVVVLTGTRTDAMLTPDQPLTCRFADELVTGFKFNDLSITVQSMKGAIPGVDLSGVPGCIASLLNEFFFLDPDDAAIVSCQALGTTDPETVDRVREVMAAHETVLGLPPDIRLEAWVQPWSPLFLMWQVCYYPIAYESADKENWYFDGETYTWKGSGAASKDLTFSGRVHLTPQNSFNFKRRLDEFRRKHPDLDKKALDNLEEFITLTDGWDFLSQALDGLMQQLGLRNIQANVTPADAGLIGLIGLNNSIVPDLGNTPQPFEGWPVSNFQQSRSGQFLFLRLMVVDRFGQSIEVVNSQTSPMFKPVVSPDLKPRKTVIPQEPYRFVQLAPRTLQPARLDFDLISNIDDDKMIDFTPDTNPVCGWILLNYVDRALSCYGFNGDILGELRVITDSRGKRVVNWEGAPGSDYISPAMVTRDFPHLGHFLGGLIQAGPQAYAEFYRVVNETLWVIDPQAAHYDRELCNLVGKPLALVRSRLQLQLDGPPIWDPSWEFVFDPATPEFVDYRFPVRMGDLVLRNDGLIGYFLGNRYDRFNSVYKPSAQEAYVKPIVPGNFIRLKFRTRRAEYLTMLMDPESAIHAFTALLPVNTLELPSRFVKPAVSRMNVTFHAGPLLTDAEVPADKEKGKESAATLLMPVPAGKDGQWSWLSPEGKEWRTYSIKQTDDRARFSNIPPVLRTGFLQLSRKKP